MAGYFWDNPKGCPTERSFIKLTKDGVYLSDLYLTAILLLCVGGTSCERAVRLKEDPNPRKRYFFIRGNPDDIRDFIEAFFEPEKSNKILTAKADALRKFTSTISYLKALLDRARVEIKNG